MIDVRDQRSLLSLGIGVGVVQRIDDTIVLLSFLKFNVVRFRGERQCLWSNERDAAVIDRDIRQKISLSQELARKIQLLVVPLFREDDGVAGLYIRENEYF